MAISLEHKSITIDVNNRNAPNVVAIANVNDKAVRYLDVTLTASGNKLTFTDCTATATFATDGYLISDSVACTINSAADVITVPLENFKSMSGFLAIEIKIANGETQVLNTPLALKVKVTPSLLDKSMIIKDSVGTAAEICREVATARGSHDSLGARLDTADANLAKKANKSDIDSINSRLQTAEKALTGKANATDVDNALKSKEDNSNKVISKTDITNSKTNYPSIEYLDAYYYKANELYSSEETDEFLGNKADVNSVYSKAETDNSLGEKADKVEVDDVKAYIGYTDEDIAGLCVDYENKTFKRLASAVNLSQGEDFDKFTMYGGRKRCNVSDDGTITAYYGDENYAEDGSNGQVMVYQPAFYYKVVPLKLEKNSDSGIGYHLRKANYYVSAKPKTGFKLHPAFYDENGNAIDYILFSADEGSMYDVSAKHYVNDNVDEFITYEDGDLLCSVAGKKPISGLRQGIGTKTNLELMAQNRGEGWHLETIKATSANQLLMMVELGIMSTQEGIGQGVVSITGNTAYNCSSLTGSTADLGNATGQATSTVNEIGGTQTAYTENGKVSVTYRGVENPWGNISKHIQGINIWGDGEMGGGQPYIANNFTFNESKHSDNYEPVGFTLPNANGYIKAMGYGSEEYDWLFMPSEIGGTSALPVGDYVYVASNLNGYRIAQLGGGCRSGDYAGSFYQIANGTVGDRSRGAGGRLVYIPTAKSGDTPTKSYSASEVDALLDGKYDSANIESGTATLTPYSTQIDKIKSATCLYEKIGDIVIVNVTVIMNATTLGGTSAIALLNMPFSNKSDAIVHDIGISKNGGMFRGSVNKSAWLQFTPLNKQAYNFVADEQVNFSLIYKI
jgi:hypothetical protein